MINQFEVPMYLEDELPGIISELRDIKDPANAYQSIHVLRNYTFRQIKANNLSIVRKCFVLAGKLFERGNQVVKCAIENMFVFSFSHLPVDSASKRKLVMDLIPGTLYTLYITQVIHHGT